MGKTILGERLRGLQDGSIMQTIRIPCYNVSRLHSDTMRRTLNLGSMRTHKEASIHYERRICRCTHFRGFILPTYHGIMVLPDLWDLNDGAYVWGFVP